MLGYRATLIGKEEEVCRRARDNESERERDRERRRDFDRTIMTLSKRDRHLKRSNQGSGRMETKHKKAVDEQEAGAEVRHPACILHLNERCVM